MLDREVNGFMYFYQIELMTPESRNPYFDSNYFAMTVL